jgi:enoyl-CoA hydratase/carnithine racemase
VKTYETISIEQEGPVLWIFLDRPERRNAMNWQMHDDLEEALQDAEEDEGTRAIILAGNGPCFCAGHDLYEVADDYLSGSFVMRPIKRFRRPPPHVVIRQISKPVIAAVHGFVGPMGVVLSISTDLVIAEQGTVFSFEQMRAGGAGCYPLIPYIIGEKKTKEWHLLGKAYTVEDLERHGLINKIVATGEARKAAKEWADEIAAMPPQNVAANKAAINMVMNVLGADTLHEVGHVYGSLGHGSEFDKSFFDMAKTKGLKNALAKRDAEHGGRDASGFHAGTKR